MEPICSAMEDTGDVACENAVELAVRPMTLATAIAGNRNHDEPGGWDQATRSASPT